MTFDSAHRCWVKWENRQRTGSFKARGAFNKVLALKPEAMRRGLVCASAGNHGQAVALAARGMAGVEVFVGENAASTKLDKMRALGAVLHVVPGGYAEAEKEGLAYARSQDKTWISPYNDVEIIAGQGTLATEVIEQLGNAPPAAFVVPVGGGGLISGVGVALADCRPRPRLIGVQPTDNAFMHALFARGDQSNLQDLPSLADGLTGAVEESSITIGMVKNLVDEIVLVSEQEIGRAIAFAWTAHHEVIEGSGAVSLAALLNGYVADRPALAVVTGGNIEPSVHARLVALHSSETAA